MPDRHRDGEAVEPQAGGDGVLDAVDELGRGAAVDSWSEDGELVTPDSCDDVVFPDPVPDCARDRTDDAVAEVVTERVVGGLQVVDVDEEDYWSKYDGVYFAGDGARVDEDGDFWLLGRVDDVMNVSGHRISTIEVESALVDHKEVAEAAVAARNDATTGQAIVAFVTLKGGAEGSVEKLEELRNHVAQKIGPIAKPANIVFTPELPKTRSGKIMRRLLRDVAENRPLGDTTTLADPTVVEEIRSRGQDEAGKED